MTDQAEEWTKTGAQCRQSELLDFRLLHAGVKKHMSDSKSEIKGVYFKQFSSEIIGLDCVINMRNFDKGRGAYQAERRTEYRGQPSREVDHRISETNEYGW